jgi:hypothetical protein
MDKRIIHPEVGLIEMECQRLLSESQSQCLLIYTPETAEADEKLRLLGIIGTQRMSPSGR